MLSGYLQALTSRVRALPLNRFSNASVRALPLSDVTVARAFVAHDVDLSDAEATYTQVSIAEQLQHTTRLLICGETGAGKTVVLWRLALGCAASLLNEGEWIEEIGGLAFDVTPLPMLLDAAALPAGIGGAAAIRELIEQQLAELGATEHWPLVEQALQRGEVLFLIDNIGAADRVAVQSFIAWMQQFPQNRYVLACRAVPQEFLPEFTACRMVPFDRDTINTLVSHWLTAAHNQGLSVGDMPLAERIADLQGRLQLNEQLYELIRRPVALAACILASLAGRQVPQARNRVYEQLVHILLSDVPPALFPAVRETILEPLAFSAELAGSRPAYASQAELMALVQDVAVQANTTPTQIIDYLLESGLLQFVSDLNGYRMPLRALRSWLAGCALARAADPTDYLEQIRVDPRRCEMLLLAVQERALRDLPLRDLLKRLLESAADRATSTDSVPRRVPPRSGAGRASLLATAPRNWADVLLVAEALSELERPEQHAPAILADTRRRLLAMLEQESCPLPERVRAGLLLGRLGDPRFEDLLPPLVEVGGGLVIIGAAIPGYDEEGPPFRLDVPRFQMGVYPVTNCEYARFLADLPRYPKPHYWYDPRFNNPSLPVVGVTWHDAQAFCEWLTGRLLDQLPEGSIVRLPTEAEWEKAASWGPRLRRKRQYPWGEEWRPEYVNISETRRSWLTTPVGCYPGGASAYGIHDLLGNVWEWTQSQYASYPGAARPFLQRDHYVLRGHSCVSLANQVRITYRSSHLPPHYWRYHLGFRVVVALPPRG